MLEKEMSRIDWNKDARTLKNLIRGLDSIMGTYTFYNGKKIKIWKADVVSDSNCNENAELNNLKDYKNGEIIIADKKKGLYVKTGNNTILSIFINAASTINKRIFTIINVLLFIFFSKLIFVRNQNLFFTNNTYLFCKYFMK